MNHNQSFHEALGKLNIEQKKAVDTIEGPVMVIAGPGTGKTQVIAARIGNILRLTDATPDNILCLTYTDAATIAMRKRLIDFIGPLAYNIHIYTFHAFCNSVIQDNLHHFGGYRDLQAITELEKVELIEGMIDDLAKDHPLKRLTGDPYYERKRLDILFNLMKQENWTSQYIIEQVDKYIKEMPFMDEFVYKVSNTKGGYKKGDPKQKDIDKVLVKMQQLSAAAELFDEYNRRMSKLQRYDFQDMIVWVLQAFENHPGLLLDYQERFQYFLVDEYQDTNGSQNALLYQLSSYWEAPNVFVVGDDDQSIYRFQGANMENILSFKQRYQDHLSEIVLTHNYRSTQAILDASRALIVKGEERLEARFPHLTKKLSAAAFEGEGDRPRVTSFANPQHENAALVQRIIEWHESGQDLDKIAVIYRNHRQVEGIVKALEKKGVPLQLRKKINILEDFDIYRVIQVCRYVSLESEKPYSGEFLLPEIMHYSFFKIHPYDIARLAGYCAYKPEKERSSHRWLDILHDHSAMSRLDFIDPSRMHAFRDNLDRWIGDYYNMTAQVFFEHILTYSGLLGEMLKSEEKAWNMQVLTTFFNFIKEESVRKQNTRMSDILTTLDKMTHHHLTLPVQQTFGREKGIHFITAHSSKGLEFEHVILLGATTNLWEGKANRSQTYSLPPTITPPRNNNLEDERRLFYVAMTRAEKDLEVTYSIESDKEKPVQESRFIVELNDAKVMVQEQEPRVLSESEMMDYSVAQILDGGTPHFSWIDHEVVAETLKTFRLSVTALNKYLECPLAFYFENILKVPSARTVHTGFGTAIHLTLERMHNYFKEQGVYPNVKAVLKIFEGRMEHLHSHFSEREYEDRMAYGKMILPLYIEEYGTVWPQIPQFQMEYNVAQAVMDDIPIKGRLDRIEIQGHRVTVIDYKTGKVDRGKSKSKGPKNEEDPGGDYWRQMVFYKLLMDNDPRQRWEWQKGLFDFVQPDKATGKFHCVEVPVTPEDEYKVKSQITEVWQKIESHEFENGCGNDECKWCRFVRFNKIDIDHSDDERSPDPGL